MAEAVLNHINASRTLLAAMAGRPNFPKVSANERMRLMPCVLALRGAPTVDIASVSHAIRDAGLCAVDCNALLDAISELATCTDPLKQNSEGRTGLQDWTTLANHLPQTLWDAMKTGSMDELVEFAVKFGLRNPSEPTAQVMALLITFSSEGFDKSMIMPPDQKMTLIKTVKGCIKQRIKSTTSPLTWTSALPKMPDDLRSKYRDVYDIMFASEAPVKSHVTEVALQQLRAATKVRMA